MFAFFFACSPVERDMDYEKKLNRMATHIRDHPADYQTKISYLINYSRMIEKRRRDAMTSRVRDVAEIRRKLNGE